MAGKRDEVTIAEVAEALDISKTTVSRAISGKGRVSEATRARVFDYIGKGRQDAAAPLRTAQQGPTNNLALVIPKHFMRLDLPFLRKCMGGVWNMAAQRGYDLLLCYAGETDVGQLERQLESYKVDGVILSRTMLHDECVQTLQRHNVPFVAIGRVDDDKVPQVDNDQVGASAEMTRLLLQLGMRRIAYMGGCTDYTVNADRLRGYLRGFSDCGVQVDQKLIWTGIETSEQRIDALEGALEQKPECLLCADDSMAVAVLQELRARHIKVPEQVKLASFYDSELLTSSNPQISAAQFDGERLGATACRMLLVRNFFSNNGIFNTMMANAGVTDFLHNIGLLDKGLSYIPFLTQPGWAMFTIIMINIWIGVPYQMLIATGVLMNIPADMIEAARIDGANPVQMFFRIKLPYLLSVQGPSLVTDFVKNVNNFNVIYLLTQDVFVTQNQALAQSNAKEIDLLVTWLFRLTQDYYNYKMAAVLGIMVFIVCAVFTIVCFHFINKKEATFS